MVRNQHKVSRIKISIKTACRICEYQLFCAHHSHEACRQHNVCYRIPLIIMYSALHDDNRHTIHISKYKPALVSGNCGCWKALDILVIYGCLYLNLLCIVSKSRAQNYGCLRYKICFFTHTCKACGEFFIYTVHFFLHIFSVKV